MGPVIRFDNVADDDAGDYICEVTSEAGTTNRSITINGWYGVGGVYCNKGWGVIYWYAGYDVVCTSYNYSPLLLAASRY